MSRETAPNNRQEFVYLPEPLMTPEEVCDWLGICRSTLDECPRPISWCKSSGEAGSVGWERSLQ